MTSWVALRAALHDLDLEEPMWVAALFAEGRGLLDVGLGLFVYSYRVAGGGTIQLGSVSGPETAPDVWRALFVWGADTQRSLARIYRTGAGSLAAWRQRAGRAGVALSRFPAAFEPHGVGDVFTIVGHDASGVGVFLTAPQSRRRPVQAPQERRAFERLAAELAAALRLRAHRRRRQVARLSARETQVARCLLEGASDQSIALELGVALSTVSTFARRVRCKLGCRPGEELLALAAPERLGDVSRRLALFERLTASECEVAAELLVGTSHADIAERRGVSVQTVASQCAAVFRKCGVSGRRELGSLLLSGHTSGK